jgi:hypothetical protein
MGLPVNRSFLIPAGGRDQLHVIDARAPSNAWRAGLILIKDD